MDLSLLLSPPQPDSSELASKIVSLLSITVMSILFGIKTYNVQFKYLTYSRWLVLVLYIISWGFTCAATLFVTTNNGNQLSCYLSELACDIFYSATKIIIYCWLIEKVWVVSSVRKSRWKTKSYRLHVGLLLPYSAIAVLLIAFHIAEIDQENSHCIIGLQPIASIPLLVYDFIFNLYFTILFVKPLLQIGRNVQSDWKQSRLHDVALRTLAASTVCLLVSFANILALVILNGRERGVLCLTCCTVDVTINVATIHWVTSSPVGKTNKDQSYAAKNNDQSHEERRGTGDRFDDPCSRRQNDIHNIHVDDYIAGDLTDSTEQTKQGKGYLGTEFEKHEKNMAGTAIGMIPIIHSGLEGVHQYGYANTRFKMVTDDQASTTSSEEQQSHSSRRSLTNVP
ncbi:hypothetical protein BX666DRAFT_2030926 [Dichotomocladium elegans]|nr:hypothetical protein BX666DRAFT_2030926 [Dichotomocladium elegans]